MTEKLIQLINGESMLPSRVVAIRIGEYSNEPYYHRPLKDRVIIDYSGVDVRSAIVIYFDSAEEAKNYALELHGIVNKELQDNRE